MVAARSELLLRKVSLLQSLRQRPPCFAPPSHLAATDGTEVGMSSSVNEPVTCVNEHITGETVLVRELP